MKHQADTTIGGYWHSVLTAKDIASARARMAKEKKGTFRGTPPKSVEVIWMLKDSCFRELVLIEGIGQFNTFTSYRKVKGGYAVQIPHRDESCCGVSEVTLLARGKKLYSGKRALPMAYVGADRAVTVEVANLVGIKTKLGRLCCAACYWVHDKLGIHELDCLCCLFTCFPCIPVPHVGDG